MTDFDIGGTANTVFGIAGMGIGLGLLAHTANNITRMSDSMYDRPRRRSNYGRMDGTQRGRRTGGRGRNRTSTCRQPRRRSSRSRRPAMYDNYWW